MMFMPPTPARRNFRPTEGMPSYRSTLIPAWLKTSAAIRPAGPPPMMATDEGEEAECWVMACAAVLRKRAGILAAPSLVGASLLAMDVNDDALILNLCGALESIASKLAPTGFRGLFSGWLKNNHFSVACRWHGLQSLSLRLSTGSSTGIVGKASTTQ
ncbi:hypothetical protein EMIT0P218_90173 [Pseudomonas sp. IT-P218]